MPVTVTPGCVQDDETDHIVVVDGVLPDSVRGAGYEFDAEFRRDTSLNHVRRIRARDGSLIYLKVEENLRAARAELLASLIWYRTGWGGIVDRVVESSDGSVLIIPPVAGVRSIVDRGGFPSAFPHIGRESPETLRVGPRARYVMRLGIEELRLRDP